MTIRRIVPFATLLLFLLTSQCKKPETHLLEPGNTETGETLDPDEVISVGIRPTVIQIDMVTELDLKAHARTRDGGFYDTVGGTWHSTNDDRATVDENGHLVPKAMGQVLIEYQWEGISAEPATIEIVAPGTMEVTVVDLLTGNPISGANVGVGYGHEFLTTGVTNTLGLARLEGDFQGPVTVSAWTDADYRHGALAQVAPRQVNLPLFPSAEGYGSGEMQGVVNFDEDEMGDGKVALAMAIPSVHGNPVSISALDLLGKTRLREGYGLEWNVPENVQINGIVDEWQGEVAPGKRVVFATGAVYDFGIALEMAFNMEAYGTGAIFPTMTQHIDELRVGFSEPIEFEPNGDVEGIEIDLMTDLPLETWLDLAPPPPGYYWPDPLLVLSWREYQDCGFVGIGFGTGDHAYVPDDDPPEDDSAGDDDATWSHVGGQLTERIWMPVREAARDGVFEDVPTRHLAFAWENGVDIGGRATGVVSSPTMRDRIVMPDFLDLIATDAPVPDSFVFAWTPPAGTDMSWVWADVECAESDSDSVQVFGPALEEFRFPTGIPRIEVDTEDCTPRYGWGTRFMPEAHSLELVSYQSLINIHDEQMKDFWEYVNRRTYAFEFGENVNFP